MIPLGSCLVVELVTQCKGIKVVDVMATHRMWSDFISICVNMELVTAKLSIVIHIRKPIGNKDIGYQRY